MVRIGQKLSPPKVVSRILGVARFNILAEKGKSARDRGAFRERPSGLDDRQGKTEAGGLVKGCCGELLREID